MSQVSYPLDTTGLSPANLVLKEPHVLTEINDVTYRTLIPDFAPFYSDNFALVFKDTLGVETTLRRDLDYVLTIPYLSASQFVGKMVYGGVAVNSVLINGSLEMTYQTIGGDEIASVTFVREQLLELSTNPRVSSWDVVANKPTQFNPIDHTHSLDDLSGTAEVVASIEDVAKALAAGPDPTGQVVKHLVDYTNPHKTTQDQVGLGDIVNLPMATDADITNRNPVDKYVTLKQVLALIGP